MPSSPCSRTRGVSTRRSSHAAKTTGMVKHKFQKKKIFKKMFICFSDDTIPIHALEEEGNLKIFKTFLPCINMWHYLYYHPKSIGGKKWENMSHVSKGQQVVSVGAGNGIRVVSDKPSHKISCLRRDGGNGWKKPLPYVHLMTPLQRALNNFIETISNGIVK